RTRTAGPLTESTAVSIMRVPRWERTLRKAGRCRRSATVNRRPLGALNRRRPSVTVRDFLFRARTDAESVRRPSQRAPWEGHLTLTFAMPRLSTLTVRDRILRKGADARSV